MCANLVRAGYEVTAGDARAEREAEVAGCGARWQGTSAGGGHGSGCADHGAAWSRGVYQAMAGSGGALAALPLGATWIHQRALARYGPADGELLAVALLEEQAGIRLRHGPRA